MPFYYISFITRASIVQTNNYQLTVVQKFNIYVYKPKDCNMSFHTNQLTKQSPFLYSRA